MGLKTSLFKLAEKFGVSKIVNELIKLEEKYGEFYSPDEYLLSLK
jgi:enoyl-CoA hydratase / 3-hydroxyacyl-CoA dehydrogenase